jgi:phage tail-like protein
MSWSLRGVHPASWTGPTLDAGSTKVAIEVLELVHEGFI